MIALPSLSIDTSNSIYTTVVLHTQSKTYEKKNESPKAHSQMLLPLIEEIVQEAGIAIDDIQSIKLNTGPGSFTGLRVGAAAVLTLGWLLDIPINDTKLSSIELIYS